MANSMACLLLPDSICQGFCKVLIRAAFAQERLEIMFIMAE